MKTTLITPYKDGGRPALLLWSGKTPPEGEVFVPAEFEDEFWQHGGFVFLEITGDTVTAMTPNIEAWEAWKAEQPPEPEPEGDPIEFLKGLMEGLTK